WAFLFTVRFISKQYRFVFLSLSEAEVIVDVLEAKINKYFEAVDHDAIASLYHSDCVIIDRQSKSALFGRDGVKSTNLGICKGESMHWKTWNKSLDLATSHFVLSGDCQLFVKAEDKAYREAKAILKPIHAAYGENLSTGNMDAVGAFYAVDGVLVHKGKSCAYGRDQIKKDLAPFAVPADTTISDEVYEATSDHIVYKAVFKTKVKSNGAEFGGKFEQIFRKEDDEWLCIYDEFEA
ncbi:hypothetical protein PENTCL1PPCAC_26495, partial [Pristionchus entomophagus]